MRVPPVAGARFVLQRVPYANRWKWCRTGAAHKTAKIQSPMRSSLNLLQSAKRCRAFVILSALSRNRLLFTRWSHVPIHLFHNYSDLLRFSYFSRGFDSHRPLHFSSGVSLRCPRTRSSFLSSSHSFDAATTGLLAIKCAQPFDRFRGSARRSSSCTVDIGAITQRKRIYACGRWRTRPKLKKGRSGACMKFDYNN
jgi:hypothetical protein